MKIEAYLRIKT